MNNVLDEIKKLSKAPAEADFVQNIFGKFKNEAVTGEVPVVLFGAGSAGKELLPLFKIHGVNPECFCDNNLTLVGTKYCGLPVVSTSDLYLKYKDSLIVVTTGSYQDEVKQQLVEIGFAPDRILIISNKNAIYFYTNLAQWYWSDKDLRSHESKLQKVYDLLPDQKSKEIFVSRIALFTGGADYQSFLNFISKFSDVSNAVNSDSLDGNTFNNINEAYLQFNNDLIHLNDNEILLDGGAFIGDSTIEFINACGKNNKSYEKIICYEPDPKIFTELENNTSSYNNIKLRPYGLWSQESNISFADSSLLKPGSTKILTEKESTFLIDNNTGLLEISTISIDEDCSDENISIIKMDIEGAEIEALLGASQTIKRWKPKLIISAYHKRNDLFEIPLLIHEMVPEYKLYFRHFSKNFNETTLFAIP